MYLIYTKQKQDESIQNKSKMNMNEGMELNLYVGAF